MTLGQSLLSETNRTREVFFVSVDIMIIMIHKTHTVHMHLTRIQGFSLSIRTKQRRKHCDAVYLGPHCLENSSSQILACVLLQTWQVQPSFQSVSPSPRYSALYSSFVSVLVALSYQNQNGMFFSTYYCQEHSDQSPGLYPLPKML